MTITPNQPQHYVRLEELAELGKPRLSLRALFLEVTSRYNAHYAIEAARQAPLDPEMKKLDALMFPPLRSEEQLLTFFTEGRRLDASCLAGRQTARFLQLRKIINETVRQRGFENVSVY